MRVTHKMMVDNVSFWTSRQAEKLSHASTVVSAGKKINQFSDDPSSASRILEDRATISTYGQYQSNLDQTKARIEACESTLDAVDTLLQEAQDILLDQSSGDLDTSEAAVELLRSIYEQIIGLANTRYGSGYMYSGNLTSTTPYADEGTVSNGSPSDILFELAEEAPDVTIEIKDSAGNVIRTLEVTGGTEGANSVAWDGLDDSGSPLANGSYDFSVSATNGEGDEVAAYSAYRGDSGSKQIIIGEDSVIRLNADGGEIFGDSLAVLSQLITALEAEDYDSDALDELNGSLSTAISGITAERVALSNIYSQLETAGSRLEQLTLTVENRLSEKEVGSDDQAVIELQTQQTAYEVTLEAAAKILKLPKLSDYL